MEHTFNYAILTAIPDLRRGERVNVGLVVFHPDRVDVRMMNAVYKLRILTGENWGERLERATQRYSDLFDEGSSPSELIAMYERLEPLLKPSTLGWFSARSADEYEGHVKQIVESLVRLPRPARREVIKTRLNTNIARVFKHVDILATPDQTIEDRRVIRDFTIDASEDLFADFALKNGKLHIVSTLDLKSKATGKGETALKSMILHKAEKLFPNQVKRIGVYSVEKDTLDTFRPQLKLLEEFSDMLCDWQSRDDQRRLTHALMDAISHEGDLI